MKVKHLHSFIGLYKTLHIATPAISRVLAQLEEVAAGISSSNPITWDHLLSFNIVVIWVIILSYLSNILCMNTVSLNIYSKLYRLLIIYEV